MDFKNVKFLNKIFVREKSTFKKTFQSLSQVVSKQKREYRNHKNVNCFKICFGKELKLNINMKFFWDKLE